MQETIIEPLSGWPHARAIPTEDGLPAYAITFQVLTPLRARMLDGCVDAAPVLLPALWLLVAYSLGLLNAPTAVLGVTTAVVVVAALLFARWALLPVFLRPHEIVMTTATVSVRRGKGWISYPRQVEHRFALKRHDFALWEQRENDAERASASIDRTEPKLAFYFADSFHVVLEQAGQRRDLLEVFGPVPAEAVLSRLQYIDRILDAAIKMGGGVPNRPEDDWDDAPGDMRP